MSSTLQDLRSKYGVGKSQTDLQTDNLLDIKDDDNEPKSLASFRSKYSVSKRQEQEDTVVDMGKKLKKKDLLKAGNIEKIRSYMIARKGVDAGRIDDDELVEKFVDHMRSFNTNLISTGGEVRFVSNASEGDKVAAKEAYQLYDQLGNVFVNDGFFGAVDGVFDYIKAAASDPSNYIGILTGGLSKAGAMGISASGKALVKRAAVEAGKKAVKDGAMGQAAIRIGNEAAESAAQRLAARGVRTPASKEFRNRIAKQARDDFLINEKKKAQRQFILGREKAASRKALMGTAGIDATLAMLNDYQIQNVMIDVGAQEEYSALQTGFSSLLGAVGAGGQLLGGRAKGSSGLSNISEQLKASRRSAKTEQELQKELLLAIPDSAVKKMAKQMNKTLDNWDAKVKRGKDLNQTSMLPSELIRDIMIGADGKGGIAKVFADEGMPLSNKLLITDVMTSAVKQLPEDQLQEIAKRMQPMVGYTLGDMTTIQQSIGDLIAANVSEGMTYGGIMSQAKRTIEAGLANGTRVMDNLVRNPQAKEAIEEEQAKLIGKKPMQLGAYSQSVWRRLLVSSPATTAINIAGFGQFYAGQTMADLFAGTASFTYGLALGGNLTNRGREALRISSVYKNIQAQKIRNLMDPYTTHDAYMSFLDEHKDISKVLFESITGGVERSGAKYGIDPNAPWFKQIEGTANAMGRLTGVRIQDTFTKSQMFMTELDKFARIKKDKTLKEILEQGDLDLLDDSVVGSALDTTLKSVYSKNYTTDDQLLRQAAKLTESISNIPLIGTILPFGRFFNNVIATSYQWSIGGAAPVMSAIYNKQSRNIETVEAAARSLVGATTIGLAINYDEERRAKGLGTFEVEGGGGTIIDAKNTYPFSLFLVAGRIGNLKRRGEDIPPELSKELGEQLAVGQLASDIEFGNDITKIMSALLNQDVAASKSSFDFLARATGNYLAGFTRPLDAANKLTGYIMDTDVAKDVRQAKSSGQLLTQSATKYFDNIFEIFSEEVEGVTGEQLAVATREGKIQDANPMAKLFGVTVLPGRTATERVYSMANMQSWTANERSQIAEYDKVFNQTVAPMLENATARLLKTPAFLEGDLEARRRLVKNTLRLVKKDVREYLNDRAPAETRLSAARSKASKAGNKELRSKALKFMKNKYNFEGSVRDMTYPELQLFTDYIDYIEDYYKQ